MHPVKTARKRGRDTTKEMIGKTLKCKYCKSPDAYVVVQEGRYMVRCICGAEYYLKQQHI